jgi:5,10-methylenetetrahydromethanopterin reductase
MISPTFGVGLFPTEPLQEMVRLAKLSENLGYSHIWIGDSHLIWREVFVNMTAVAMNTAKVKIGTGVTNPLTRHPSVVASGFATLEEFAPERFILGIGLGDSALETMGMKPARLGPFEAVLTDIRALLNGKEVELETGKIHLKHPVKDGMPIFVAASGPRMLELAGRVADGIILLVGIDDNCIRHAKERIEAGATAANRDPRKIEIVLWVPCSVSERPGTKDAVKAHVARIVAHPLPFLLDEKEQKVLEEIRVAYNYYQHMEQKASQAQVIPDWLVDKFAITGSRQAVRARIERMEGLGIKQIAIIPYGAGGSDREETLKEFAAAVF